MAPRRRSSSIDKLTPALRTALEKYLNDANITQAEAARRINTLAGEQVVSKSAVNRYAVQTKDFRDRTLQAEQIAAVWAKELGNEPTNELSRVLHSMLRTHIFDLTLAQSDKSGEDAVDIARKLAGSLRDLEHAANAGQERERKLRVLLAQEHGGKVEKAAATMGLSKSQGKALRDAIVK